ncbi:MAG: hypothetical protein ACFB02_11080 [Mastigocoleus sp.]
MRSVLIRAYTSQIESQARTCDRLCRVFSPRRYTNDHRLRSPTELGCFCVSSG